MGKSNKDIVKAYKESTTAKTGNLSINTGSEITSVDPSSFYGFLVDKIVLSITNQHNFIDKLDSLYGESIEYGDIIEDRATVLKSNLFNYDTEDFTTDIINPFFKHKKGLVVCNYKLNDFKKISITTSYDQLRAVCLNENGISSLINGLINDVEIEQGAWAYKRKKECLSEREKINVQYFKDYADFSIKLKDAIVDVTNYDNSYKYNDFLLLSPASLDNLVIIMSNKFKNAIDINFFTGLFNVEYAEIKDNIIFIDEFTDPDIVCGLYDKRGLIFKKCLSTSKELENGADLSRNRFVHTWRMHYLSPLYTAVVFKQGDESMSDESILINGWDATTQDVTDSYDLTPPFTGTYSTDGKTWGSCDIKTPINLENPSTIDPYIVRFSSDTNHSVINKIIRVRFEYPSYADATFTQRLNTDIP